MNNSWKDDPRLKDVDPARVSALCSLAEELSGAPKEQKVAVFLSVSQKAAAMNLNFSPNERDLFIDILTKDMPPEEKKRVRLIQSLALKANRNQHT